MSYASDSRWLDRQFLDALRETLGLKPLYASDSGPRPNDGRPLYEITSRTHGQVPKNAPAYE